jgi:hypothetical protein
MQEDLQTPREVISTEQVTSYLRSHPHFFEQHASLLAEIYLPSPHGSGAISLAERQQLAQRDKIRALEIKLANLIGYAEENDATSGKVHDLSINLLKNSGFGNLQSIIANSMQQDFSVTESAIRIWRNPTDSDLLQEAIFSPLSEDFNEWLMALDAPYCGAKPALAEGLFSDNLQSFAFIPLYLIKEDVNQKQVFGVLALGATGPQHFKAGMGLTYLERIGDLVGASFSMYF